jgi:hypothetical protein
MKTADGAQMATRFDRVTQSPNRTVTEVREQTAQRLEELDLEVRALLRASQTAPSVASKTKTPPYEVPTGALAVAMSAWLAMVFASCYVALPFALAVTGIDSGVLVSSVFALPAFVISSFVAVIGIAIARPKVRITDLAVRDPVLSATAGGLGAWALIHNTSALLQPFWAMGPLELASFLALNVLEMTLLGMMFASFTRNRLVAAGLGAGFQTMVLGLVLMFLKLALL